MGSRPSFAELLVLEAAAGYAVGLLRIGRGSHDFTDTLIQAEVLHANAGRLRGDPRLQQMYATFYAPPPDSLRRVAQAPGVARNLGIPVEAVRRRVRRLAAEGVFDLNRRGILFSERALRSEAHRILMEEVYALTRGLYLRLRRDGAIASMALRPPKAGMPSSSAPPFRIVLRQAVDAFLALARAFARSAGAIPDGFILMEVIGGRMAAEASLDGSAFASDLGLPLDVVRSGLAGLIAHGLLAESGGAAVARGPSLDAERTEALATACHAALASMLSALSEVGVLSHWDSEAQAEAEAA